MAGAMVAVTSESAACSQTPIVTSRKRLSTPGARKSWARSAPSIEFTRLLAISQRLLEGTRPASTRAGAAERQRPQELRQAVPEDLNADAEQQEGGERTTMVVPVAPIQFASRAELR